MTDATSDVGVVEMTVVTGRAIYLVAPSDAREWKTTAGTWAHSIHNVWDAWRAARREAQTYETGRDGKSKGRIWLLRSASGVYGFATSSRTNPVMVTEQFQGWQALRTVPTIEDGMSGIFQRQEIGDTTPWVVYLADEIKVNLS